MREHGGKCLNIKGLWRYIQNPIYSGVSMEKWTENQRVKARYNGLVSIDTFNKANRGKIIISEDNREIKIYKRQAPEYLIEKGKKSAEFAYRKYVMCPHCERPLYGSASRGRLGKYYPAYHCSNRGHKFRIPKQDFEEVICKFIKNIDLSQEYIDELVSTVNSEWEKRYKEVSKDYIHIDERTVQMKTQAKITVDKIKVLTSDIAIKYMEEDLIKIEQQMTDLLAEKQKAIES